MEVGAAQSGVGGGFGGELLKWLLYSYILENFIISSTFNDNEIVIEQFHFLMLAYIDMILILVLQLRPTILKVNSLLKHYVEVKGEKVVVEMENNGEY